VIDHVLKLMTLFVIFLTVFLFEPKTDVVVMV
jgi:hypothetical protein